MARRLALALILPLLAGPGAAPAQEAPALTHLLEVGVEFGSYSDDLGEADAEFLAYTLTRPERWSLRLDLGRAARFEDEGVSGGVSLTGFLPRGLALSAGVSSGSGDVIDPDWRLDLGALAPLPGGRCLISLGYTRVQSKDVNKSDGYSAGLTCYAGDHWLLAAGGRYELGYPGRTESSSLDLSVTWFQWLTLYLGAGARFGAVSYQLIGPGSVIVDYDETAWYLTLTRHVRPDWGFNARFELAENDFYTLRTVRVSLFKEW
ncbi:MAG: YaiO family outer membrane beta-barrel protein [Candidatus Krumholzibacteriota bacterium]|nr:YaiO family outer membrane beta-barrel protein [Candidatus Krumholzibacteriota bacterium]